MTRGENTVLLMSVIIIEENSANCTEDRVNLVIVLIFQNITSKSVEIIFLNYQILVSINI